MKITEYPTAQFFDENDVLIKDGTNGTKQIKASDMVYALFDPIPEMHKEIFRGKSLGSTFTTAQQQALSDGSFHDLWLGDYWESGETKYRIVDFDYFYDLNNYDTEGQYNVTQHHVVVMPDSALVSTTTAFGSSKSSWRYSDSVIRTGSAMSQTRSAIQTFFGEEHILSHRDICIFAIRFNGLGDDAVHCDRDFITMTIELPSLWHIIGLPNNLSRSGTYPFMNQFRLFQLCHRFIPSATENTVFWTKDIGAYVANANTYSPIGVSGRATTAEYRDPTSHTLSPVIRPYFCLKG